MRITDEFFSSKIPSFFLCCGIFDFIDLGVRILRCGHEIKVQKVWRNIFWKKHPEKFYHDFTKTLFFIILHVKNPQHEVLMLWSICHDIQKKDGNFEERNWSNNFHLGLS